MRSSLFIVILFAGSVYPQIWTWMGGPQTLDDAGVYGTEGTPNRTNIPAARVDGQTWVDNNGDLWLFGGGKYPDSSNAFKFKLNL